MQTLPRLLYSGILTAALFPALLRKLAKDGSAGLHLSERLAHAPLPGGGPLWINAASVGELGVAARLLDGLREHAGSLPVFVTVSSEAARQLAPQRAGVAAHSLPLDYPRVADRFFDRLQPRMCILVEQELWPNLIAAASARSIPAAVVNGRMSARSARRHARLLRCTGGMFSSLSLVTAGTRADARRFSVLGAPEVEVTGNIKFDAEPDREKVAAGLELRERLRQRHGSRPVLLLASTRPAAKGESEELMLIEALGPLLGEATVILVPRHPARSDQVSGMLKSKGLEHARYSDLGSGGPAAPLILGDTLGDLDSFIAAADVVFIGASLVDAGGQNPMEAMAQGKPVLMGPHTRNFADLVAKARRRGALRQLPDAGGISEAARELLADGGTRQAMGEAGKEIARQERGATSRTIDALRPLLERSGLVRP